MELNASRIAARTDAAGDPILLMDQNRTRGTGCRSAAGYRRWRGRTNSAAGADFYALQAAIVACHARAATPDDTDWPRIAALYAELAALVRSPIIELNRAVAVGMAEGRRPRSTIVDGLAGEPALKNYHLLQSVRGDLLCKLQPLPAVWAYWIREEDYPALLHLFDDGDKMPPSWKEWLKMAEEMEQGLKAYDHVVLRVDHRPRHVPGLVRRPWHKPRQRRTQKFLSRRR